MSGSTHEPHALLHIQPTPITVFNRRQSPCSTDANHRAPIQLTPIFAAEVHYEARDRDARLGAFRSREIPRSAEPVPLAS